MKHTSKLGRVLALTAVLGCGLLLAVQAWAKAGTYEEIAERLKPAGELCVEGMDCGGVVESVSSAPKSGVEVYNSTCTACHAIGVAGAPKLGDKAAWATRLNQGLDTVYANSLNGIRGMPAKGGNPRLSDAEVKGAVDYMLESSR